MKVVNKAIKVNKTPKKGTKVQQRLGVTDDEIKRAVAVDFVIDTARRTSRNPEPRMLD